MLIRIGMIPQERIATAATIAHKLEVAVEAGTVSRADELSLELAGMMEPDGQITLSEKDWRELNLRTRSNSPRYEASYLLSPKVCVRLQKNASGVEFRELAEILAKATSEGLHLLQLPVAEDIEHA